MQKTEQDEPAYSFWQLLEKQEAGYSYEPEPDQLCTIMFTSGTTGKSKGVMLTHRNLAENATCLDMKTPERTVILSVLPIHHAYCLSMDILKGLHKEGRTVILITHDNEIAAQAKRVIKIKDGKVESDSGQIVPVEELQTAGA